MKQFVSPQFIDVEDRIIGPITTRQFVMMVFGGIVIFAAWKIFDELYAAVISFIIACVVVVFGFVKINGRYFGEFISNMIETLRRPRLRVWYKHVSKVEVSNDQKNKDVQNEIKTDFTPRQRRESMKNLSQLALLVDTGGKFGPKEE